MTKYSTSSSCGACKFLRRKCVNDCIFAPYFSYEQAATHFAAIHKVFGASNVSKLLAHLPASDRSEATLTISYEAQARLQDPIFGCVSHIFALQQQVVNLQTQLAFMREQAAHHQSVFINDSATENPNNGKLPFHGKLVGSCCEDHHVDHSNFCDLEQYSNMTTQFNSNLISMPFYQEKEGSNSININDQNPIGSSSYHEYSANHPTDHENISYSYSFEEASNMPCLEQMQTNNKLQYWGFQDAHNHEFNQYFEEDLIVP